MQYLLVVAVILAVILLAVAAAVRSLIVLGGDASGLGVVRAGWRGHLTNALSALRIDTKARPQQLRSRR